MNRIFKYIGVIFGIVVAIIIVFIIITYANHKINLSKEDKLFVPFGQMVEVNGYDMHVYTEGEEETTLVFMSGGGTSSPVLDFKSLYTLLSNEHRIVVVEKVGYGFSDLVDIDRDIDAILSDTREALLKAGINGPYILCPHSMSGIEALHWAHRYPDEVMAIVGLDMAVPESYKEYNINMPMMQLSAFAAKIGVTRWIPSLAESDAIKYGTLTEDEKDLYRAIFYRRTATKPMLNEVDKIKKNAGKLNEDKVPNIPILMFSSNGKGTGWNKDIWTTLQKDYIEKAEAGEIINLDCSHYVHNIEYKKIAKEIEMFIKASLRSKT